MFDIPFNIVKTLDIAFLSIIQFSFAIIINIVIDKFFLPQSELVENNPNVFSDFIFLCITVAVLVTIAYTGKNIIRKLPSPFHSWSGYQHNKLKELSHISALVSFLLLTSGVVERRISSIRNYFGLNTKFSNIDKKDNNNAITIN